MTSTTANDMFAGMNVVHPNNNKNELTPDRDSIAGKVDPLARATCGAAV